MRSKNSTNKSTQIGFTIVEVVIVLAIAALILMAVFLVVPSAQRAVRNHSRRQHASQFLAALEGIFANSGSYPINMNSPVSTWKSRNDDFLDNNSYLNNPSFVDPLGKPYTINYGPSISGLGHIDWFVGATCDQGVFTSGSGFRGVEQIDSTKIAVVIGLEPGDYDDDGDYGYWVPEPDFGNGPEDTTYCIDNS